MSASKAGLCRACGEDISTLVPGPVESAESARAACQLEASRAKSPWVMKLSIAGAWCLKSESR